MHEAYFYRFLCWGKVGGWCQPSFFCEVSTKVPYFFMHNTPIHHRSTIETDRNHVRWPPNHRAMATIATQHHRRCLPSPPLLPRPSILPRSQRNSPRGSTTMGRFHGRAALRHKMCSGGGTYKTIGSRPALFDSFDDRGM